MNAELLPDIEFEPNREKILEAVVFLIERAVEQRQPLSQYDIVKTLFLADRSHLNRYGRPITYDNYVAMEHGPVPSFAYNMLKPDFDFNRYFGVHRAPWVVEREGPKSVFTRVHREPNLRVFSKSDRTALQFALRTATSLSFGQLKRVTHQDPAYIEAWDGRGSKRSSPMKWALLLDDQDPDAIETLHHLSTFK